MSIYNPELVEQVKQLSRIGHSDDEVEKILEDSGYEPEDVRFALLEAQNTRDEDPSGEEETLTLPPEDEPAALPEWKRVKDSIKIRPTMEPTKSKSNNHNKALTITVSVLIAIAILFIIALLIAII